MVKVKTKGTKSRGTILVFLIVLALLIFAVCKINYIAGFLGGIFSGGSNRSLSSSLDLSAEQGSFYTDCYELCVDNEFRSGYNSITETSKSCRDGETFATWKLSDNSLKLYCCCVPKSEITCVDSDGEDKNSVGNVKFNGETYMDKCLDVGEAVTEYICVDGNKISAKNLACDLGYVCMQTRSGGHCIPDTPAWNAGDTVFEGSGSGSLMGVSSDLSELDLSDYGITVGGTCRLGVQLQTSWAYGNQYCQGVQGNEGMIWKLFDSSGLEYQRIDPTPVALGVDLHPEAHTFEWDGVNNWRGIIEKTLNLPNCIINYEYYIKVYIYDC